MSIFADLSHSVADGFLRTAVHVFTSASNSAVVETVLMVIQRSFEAIGQSLTGAAVIWMGIFTNGINEPTLRFILDNLYALFQFLYDLIKPANVIGGINNAYNELDLRIDRNRLAVIHQVQRVALTITTILKIAWERMPPHGLGDIVIDVSLSSDLVNGQPVPDTHVSALPQGTPDRPEEKWLFVNGIANERIWFELSCDKIRDAFKRDVKGIYNRSDGILWDLVECAGERSAAESNVLISRTRSSMAAQRVLVRELRDALWPAGGAKPEKVVMIAHSQGCLVLRLALKEILVENQNGLNRRGDLRERLRVFTFGNPSVDWGFMDVNGFVKPLSNYARTTEHYAHETDFVAMLGVVTHRDDPGWGYDSRNVYYSREGRGHLLGAHYPFEVASYVNGARSLLFRALDGGYMA